MPRRSTVSAYAKTAQIRRNTRRQTLDKEWALQERVEWDKNYRLLLAIRDAAGPDNSLCLTPAKLTLKSKSFPAGEIEGLRKWLEKQLACAAEGSLPTLQRAKLRCLVEAQYLEDWRPVRIQSPDVAEARDIIGPLHPKIRRLCGKRNAEKHVAMLETAGVGLSVSSDLEHGCEGIADMAEASQDSAWPCNSRTPSPDRPRLGLLQCRTENSIGVVSNPVEASAPCTQSPLLKRLRSGKVQSGQLYNPLEMDMADKENSGREFGADRATLSKEACETNNGQYQDVHRQAHWSMKSHATATGDRATASGHGTLSSDIFAPHIRETERRASRNSEILSTQRREPISWELQFSRTDSKQINWTRNKSATEQNLRDVVWKLMEDKAANRARQDNARPFHEDDPDQYASLKDVRKTYRSMWGHELDLGLNTKCRTGIILEKICSDFCKMENIPRGSKNWALIPRSEAVMAADVRHTSDTSHAPQRRMCAMDYEQLPAMLETELNLRDVVRKLMNDKAADRAKHNDTREYDEDDPNQYASLKDVKRTYRSMWGHEFDLGPNTESRTGKILELICFDFCKMQNIPQGSKNWALIPN